MPLGGGSLAGVARIAFEATGVGEISRDIEQVEQKYRSSTGEMSDAAIKLQLAQERLQRTLRQGPGAYRAQASAELQVAPLRARRRLPLLERELAKEPLVYRSLGCRDRGSNFSLTSAARPSFSTIQ